MSKNNKKNLGKLRKTKRSKKSRKNKTHKKCNKCNFIRFGGCSDCGMSISAGGSCGCKSIKKGGTPNMDKLPNESYYPLNNYNNDVSTSPFLKSSRLLGDFSSNSKGGGKTKKKRGGGITNFLNLPYSDYVTTNNTIDGINVQKGILTGHQVTTSSTLDHPVYNNPYGSQNPPLI